MTGKPQEGEGKTRVLIATAGFGDGHNSAARNLALALEEGRQAVARVTDPCAEGAPLLNGALRRFYREVTTRAPWLWKRIYEGTERRDFRRQSFPFMRRLEDALEREVLDFRPDVVASTYPLYPYLMERIFDRERLGRLPVATVVTDSININGAWRKAPTDCWLVTDGRTRERLLAGGLEAERVHETGFPVHPSFGRLAAAGAEDAAEPFRVLYFATARWPHVRKISRAVLGHPRTRLTVVLGRSARRLYKRAREIKAEHPGRVVIRGWCRRVPDLVTRHHLIVGKAGGATVHEALAGQCPMLIHHLVPGQEEGNLELLRYLGAGELARTPGELAERLGRMLADDAREWRAAKRRMRAHCRPNAAATAAGVVLGMAGKGLEA